MTSRKNIKIFYFSGVHVAKHMHVAGRGICISDWLVGFVTIPYISQRIKKQIIFCITNIASQALQLHVNIITCSLIYHVVDKECIVRCFIIMLLCVKTMELILFKRY